MNLLNRLERGFEHFLFQSRWIAAPIYLGLVLSLIILLIAFFNKIMDTLPIIGSLGADEAVLTVLTFIDIALIANLTLIVIFAGYESFVSKFDQQDHPDRPDWMGTVGFSGLKLKLFASLVAISGIELLKAFMAARTAGEVPVVLPWLIGVHLTFVTTALITALAGRLRGGA